MSRFTTVPPAVVPMNADEHARSDREIRTSRSRQATFERGVALALVSSMLDEVRHLTGLTTGLRWLYADEDADAVKRWLRNLREDILRAERIEDRADAE